MSLTNPNKVVTEERLNEYHNTILPYLGGMPEILANKFSKSDLYSTDERMIGQWIDGKPLYQKVFTGNMPNTTNVWNTLLEVEGVKFIKGQFYVIDSVNMYDSFINNFYTVYLQTVENEDTSRLPCKILQDFIKNLPYYAIIQYTKTSDNTVSIGNDTDYSTEEKIVGTWIDGKPLYQKMYHYTNLTPDSTAHNMDTLPNTINVVKLDAYQTNSGMCMSLPYKQVGDNYIAWVDVDKYKIRWYTKWDGVTISNLYVILQYTKTT